MEETKEPTVIGKSPPMSTVAGERTSARMASAAEACRRYPDRVGFVPQCERRSAPKRSSAGMQLDQPADRQHAGQRQGCGRRAAAPAPPHFNMLPFTRQARLPTHADKTAAAISISRPAILGMSMRDVSTAPRVLPAGCRSWPPLDRAVTATAIRQRPEVTRRNCDVATADPVPSLQVEKLRHDCGAGFSRYYRNLAGAPRRSKTPALSKA